MRLYPWDLPSAVLTIVGIMALGVFPPLGMIILLVAFLIRRRFVGRIKYWERLYQVKQDERRRQDLISTLRKL